MTLLPRAPTALLFALAISAAVACSNGAKPQNPTPAPEPPTATVTAKPRLNLCPPDVGDEICEFAAAAQGFVRRGEATALAGPGSTFEDDPGKAELAGAIATALPVSEGRERTLRSITCPMVSKPPPEPDCSARFALVFATITPEEITAAPVGMLVLGFERTPGGARLLARGVPQGPGRLYVMVGPLSSGDDLLPGVDDQARGLGHKVYPVEVLAPGQEPAPPAGSPEVIGGLEVRPLRIGGDATLPSDAVVYLGPTRWASDSNPVLLWRAYRAPDGTIRRDDLFGNAKTQHGPLAITSWAANETFSDITLTACQSGSCRGTGVGGWAGEFDVFRSRDGGITWAAAGQVPAMSFPKAVTAEGVIFGQYLGRDSEERPQYRFFLSPSGAEVTPPAPNTEPRNVPGLGVVWEPTFRQRGLGPEASYDSTGKPIPGSVLGLLQTRIAAREHGGGAWASWTYSPDRPSDPHPPTGYVGRVDALGTLSAIFSSEAIVQWNGPFVLSRRYLVSNAEVTPPPDAAFPFDVPAVLIDLSTGFFSPLRELNEGLEPGLQPLVRGVVPGRVARVRGSGTCLNIRADPAVSSATLTCARDGVLLFERGETQEAGGMAWVAVTTPSGESGWASAAFLERHAP